MHRRSFIFLFLIALLAIGASYVVFWPNASSKPLYGINNPFVAREGLDLQGGVSVLLVPRPGQDVSPAAMQAARNQIEQRINGGLSVNEPDIRIQYSNSQPRIAVQLPGLNNGNQQEAIETLLKTGKLAFWDTGHDRIPEGTTLKPQNYAQYNQGVQPLFTGKDLDVSSLGIGQDSQTNAYQINFAMKGDAVGRFSKFTANHIGEDLTITLDGGVIESAAINSQIPGSGRITGSFTYTQAQRIVEVLKYGALPIAFSIQSEQTVSPTLGQDSINKTLVAGALGLGVVILFMFLYYRLPGFLADISLVLYAIFTFAVFKLIGVTLTLPGIAGFILSIGMAVDANVLIFERLKEELREGRSLSQAIDMGWARAWPSIRDSNCSTLITCAVLYFFGNNFSATIIVGFATTLFLGVLISMFTAILVTRTFLKLLVTTGLFRHPGLFGLPVDAMNAASS
ncbi:protein translocase subunit SecD [Ktedonosporobacter rubrisoli]|uniref:Protein translocase subunit SecD n=1 Tax=Ktedonosporobacter rubrisoli TaxID=2509675 RepID=A0A4P6JPD1_KTERU|nr:protein translocase subunit SecD [Ktedonosporobacter rubrisoli]QBD77063.1 protein translocase subunit SecD [Ktedonosporobacter rubrisoli]